MLADAYPMNSPRSLVRRFGVVACALCVAFARFAVPAHAQETYQAMFPFPVADESGARSTAYSWQPLTDALLALLKNGDAEAFAAAMTPTREDLVPIILRYPDTKAAKRSPEKTDAALAEKRASLADSARRLLARAKELGVDFSAMELTAKADDAHADAGYPYLDLLPENHWFHTTRRLEVTVTARSQNPAEKTGEYRVAVKDLVAVADAWRVDGPLSWTGLPDSVATDEMRLEMKLVKAAAGYGSLSGKEDPALARLADSVAALVRDRDIAAYERAATLTPEAEWELRVRQGGGASSKSNFIAWHEKKSAKNRAALEALLATLARSGIDLGAARVSVTAVGVRNLMVRSDTDPAIGLEGNQLRVALRVEGEGKAANGRDVAGEYSLVCDEIVRDGGAWWIEKELIWEKLPDGVVDEAVAAEIAFEAHVNQTGTLPPGAPAPDFEFVRIADGEKGRLADLRGKIVILDFWAVWCGPCQQPMADMQTYAEKNPAWGDRVAVVSLSIDDTLESPKKHLATKGWTKSLNLWGGEGGWGCAPAKAFRVRGVPTCYVIDADGKIAEAGHPGSLRAPEVVDRLLLLAGRK